MMEGSEVVHEDGRKCAYSDDNWWFKVNPDLGRESTVDICDRDHPSTERGEFGMPGLGKGRVREFAEPGTATWSLNPGRVHEVPVYPTLQIREDELFVDYGNQGYSVPIATDDAKHVMSILPDIITTFLQKNQKYALVEDGYDLGDQGIIPDLNRKLGILVARIWHGAGEVGESTDEVIGDMIGHLLLMLAKRRD